MLPGKLHPAPPLGLKYVCQMSPLWSPKKMLGSTPLMYSVTAGPVMAKAVLGIEVQEDQPDVTLHDLIHRLLSAPRTTRSIRPGADMADGADVAPKGGALRLSQWLQPSSGP